MKTLIKPLLIAFSLSVFAVATPSADAKPIGRPTAAATYKTGIYTSINGKLNIALDKQTAGTVDILLKSADGQLLYSQHIGKNQPSLRTRLNLNELPDGVYQLEITNGVETTRQTITVSTKQPNTPGRIIRLDTVPANA